MIDAPHGRATGPNGFSLVEALIALVMLTAGALVMGAALSATNGAARDSLEATIAQHLARQKMTELRLLPASEIGNGSDALDLDGILYLREWTVRPRSQTGLSDLSVDVTWSEYAAPLSSTSPEKVTGMVSSPRTTSPTSLASSDPTSEIRTLIDESGRTRTRSIVGFRAN